MTISKGTGTLIPLLISRFDGDRRVSQATVKEVIDYQASIDDGQTIDCDFDGSSLYGRKIT